MAERMVQAPASLIADAISLIRHGDTYSDERAEQIEASLRALLSQTEPSAEPLSDRYQAEFEERLSPKRPLLSQPSTETSRKASACGCGYHPVHAPNTSGPLPSDPPRIEDMAPGTTCGKDVPGTVPSWAGEDQVSPCWCVLLTGHAGAHQCEHEVDPSTMTPPKEKP